MFCTLSKLGWYSCNVKLFRSKNFFYFFRKHVFFTSSTDRFKLLNEEIKKSNSEISVKDRATIPKRVNTTRWESRLESVKLFTKDMRFTRVF